MKKVRLKANCPFGSMHTPYGSIGHSWTDVPDNAHIYGEMETFGQEEAPKPEVKEEIVEEAAEEAKETAETEEVIKEEPKKKGRGRRR